MFSSTFSCVSCSFGHKLFLFLLPVTLTLFASQHIGTTVASPFVQQRADGSVIVPLPFPSIPMDSNRHPTYYVYSSMDRPIYEPNDAIEDDLAAEEAKTKRAQTFVRFGKRAQTFVRFGKRAQTFVRFGRDVQRQQHHFAGKIANEQQQRKD